MASPLRAVHDDDLRDVLEGLGMLNALLAGKLHCKFCGDVVGWDNLHSIFPDSGDVKLACSKATCVKALLRYINAQANPSG